MIAAPPSADFLISVQQDLRTSIVKIQSADHRSTMMTLSFSVQANTTQDEAKLVFNRYGDRYFLAQVWTPGTNAGRQLRKSPAENELIARSQSEPVTLVAYTK